MASVISGDPKDRSSLSVFRSVGGTVAGIMIGVVAPMLVYKTDAYGNQVVSATNISIVATKPIIIPATVPPTERKTESELLSFGSPEITDAIEP